MSHRSVALPARGRPRAAGVTLLEILVALAIGLAVLGWVVGFLWSQARSERVVSDEARAVERLSLAVCWMFRDLSRIADTGGESLEVEPSGGAGGLRMSFPVWSAGVDGRVERVTYELACSTGRLSRRSTEERSRQLDLGSGARLAVERLGAASAGAGRFTGVRLEARVRVGQGATARELGVVDVITFAASSSRAGFEFWNAVRSDEGPDALEDPFVPVSSPSADPSEAGRAWTGAPDSTAAFVRLLAAGNTR